MKGKLLLLQLCQNFKIKKFLIPYEGFNQNYQNAKQI